MHKLRRKNKFSLMEIVVVVAIIALLGTIITPMYFKHVKKARRVTAQTQIKFIEEGIMDYQIDNGSFPKNLEGLVKNDTGDKKWEGPYLKSGLIPKDPWGNEYQFRCPGEHGSFDLYSYGEDGTSAKSTDYIGNWTTKDNK